MSTTWRWATPLDWYRKGYAVGHSDIVQDHLHFRFYEDVFVIKDRSLKTEKRGQYMVAKIEDVRKLASG